MKRALIIGVTGQDGSYLLAGKIAALTGFSSEIQWGVSKPNGQPRRHLDVSRAEARFGFRATTPPDEGLKKTIDWCAPGLCRTAECRAG